MKKLAILSAVAILTTSCAWGIKGNGDVKRVDRDVSDFHSIDVGGAFEVHIRQGSDYKLSIEADDNLLDLISTEVRAGELHIKTEENIRDYKQLAVFITMPELRGLDISGACEISTDGKIKGEDLDLDFSGATEAELQLDYRSVDADLSGASELSIDGRASMFRLESSGASEIDAVNFEVSKAKVDISGAGEAKLNVKDELDVDISGAGEVRYRGNPRVISETSGAGSIRAIKD